MKTIKILLLVSLGVLLSGCNTARGVGADLEVLGRKMQGLKNDDVMVAGNRPAQSNVVEVPTTYRSNEPYSNGSYSNSNDSYSNDSYSNDSYSNDGFSSSSSGYTSSLEGNLEDVYSTPYEDAGTTYSNLPDAGTTYSNLPDAVTYPVE